MGLLAQQQLSNLNIRGGNYEGFLWAFHAQIHQIFTLFFHKMAFWLEEKSITSFPKLNSYQNKYGGRVLADLVFSKLIALYFLTDYLATGSLIVCPTFTPKISPILHGLGDGQMVRP